ncbi:hypothetical protein [Thermomonospora cellulosilytica]|uniref:Uncharacterized protein n=1 Tax=Thermomonospora cellulosilytica TaxID=1411118 RepID=A0A7W3MXI6_9ACTN|nr:hypothetical protein [Thermomonospora cellulosilytica]MBA9003698.1 hypothetical protein [Thermomonospora cellulosilytica]
MSMHEDAARLAVLRELAARIRTARDAAAEGIRDGWEPGDRATAKLPDGTPVGSVTLAKGRAKADVTDEAAFLEWVARTHPEELETVTVTRVDPEFRERLISAARQLGAAVDPATGEEVPGVTVTVGEPYPQVRLDPAAGEAIAKAWRSGGLAELVGGLLELESGAES